MVKGLFIKKVIREYQKELGKHHIRPQEIIVYGSCATGRPKPHSDIDLVIVSSDLARFSQLKRQELLAEWTININAPLEVIGYTPEEMKKAKNTVFGEIIRSSGKRLMNL